MAQRFISPGVFTQENDLSFLPQGIAQIGGAFIGPTVKGPAFVPTIVESQDDFLRRFGTPIPEYYVGNAVQEYLKDAARATVVRVLGLTGYAASESSPAVLMIMSGSVTKSIAAAIFPAANTLDVTPLSLVSASVSGTITSFSLELNNGQVVTSLTGSSIDTTSPNYFAHALGSTPTTPQAGYVLLNFVRDLNTILSASGDLTASHYSVAMSFGTPAQLGLTFSGSTFGVYSPATTPSIQSQNVGGARHNLFTVSTFSDGNAANNDIKVSISDIKPASANADDQHGTFALLVRAIGDTDSRINILEQFDNLSLDPTSPDYIARRIGDQHFTVDANGNLTLEGEFASNSKYIYVTMTDGIENIPDTCLPAGFERPRSTLNSTYATFLPTASFVLTRFEVPVGAGTTESVENVRRYYGWDYEDNVDLALLNPLPSGAALVGTAFSLESVTDWNGLTGTDSHSIAADFASGTVGASGVRKFTVPFQGGFDGLNPSRVLATGADITATNTQGFNLQLSTSPGSLAYQQAIDIISNDEAFDINLVVLPGVLYSLHPFVATLAINMCEDRGDCFYIMDAAEMTDNVDTAVNVVSGLDTNYAGTYHPWVKILDDASNRLIWVPPSVVMPGVYAFNDKVAAEWFAPAGLNRGGITSAIQVRQQLRRADRDTLYDGRVNPIASFPGEGIVAFGQKTLQVKSSALDRINVRRLMIAVKKFIASTARFLVFEQNVESTRQRFLNIVNPFLASVQERSGLYAFKVIMDDSNNTPDLIDRNILVGQLFLQPTRTAEFISLEFNILPTGATFPTGA